MHREQAKRMLVVWVAGAALLAMLGPIGCSTRKPLPNTFHLPSTGVSAKNQALLLAIDDILLPVRSNLNYYLSKPQVLKQPVLTPRVGNPKAPDQIAAFFYGSVLNEGGKYRMWYYPLHIAYGQNLNSFDEFPFREGPVCYAESADGIRWTRPDLEQVEFAGSRANNAISLPDDRIMGVHVIKDEDDSDPQRRYKMVYNIYGRTSLIRTATSPDGIRWHPSPGASADSGSGDPRSHFIETSSFYRFSGLYVVHGQRSTRSEGGHDEGRQGRACISGDFAEWLPGHADAFLITEPADPSARGDTKPYDQVHLGVGGAAFGNVVVGLYGLWHNSPGKPSKLPDSWFGFNKTSGDLGLVISNDGLHFREPVKGYVYLSRHDSPATPLPGRDYPTILCQSGNGILNVGDQTLIYHGRWRNSHYGRDYWSEVALATLPRDRWGALGLYPEGSRDSAPEGWVWSAPVTLPETGCDLKLNADHANQMRVEVTDEHFRPLPQYSGAKSGRTETESGLDCPVAWPEAQLSALGGRTVRFRTYLKRDAGKEPRLYALSLKSS